MRAIEQINELDKPPRWHHWLAVGITMPFRLLLLVIGFPILLMLCIEDEDFRKLLPGVKNILVGKLEMDGGSM